MSNLELRIDESSDLSFDAVDFVGIPFAPTVEVEDIVGGHRVSITSMGADGKKTDEFDVMDGATWLNGNILIGTLSEAAVLTADDAYAAPPKGVEVYGKSTQDGTPTPDAPVEIKSVDDLMLHVCGKNVWGGTALRDAALAGYSLNFTGADSIGGDYVTIRAQNYGLFSMPFKANTQYTLVMKFSKNDTNANVNIEFRYTNGTTTSVQKQGMAASTLYTIAVTSTANKTVKEIRAWNASGITYCYYEGCGLFEGAITADQFEPYVGQSVEIPLNNHIARSLPDGTRDELTLSYVGPSTEHEGWGVYSKTLVQKVGVATINASEWQGQPAVSIGDGWYRTVKDVLSGAESVTGATATQGMCTAAPFVYNTTLQSEHVGTQNMYILLVAQESTAAAIAAKYDGATIIYKLKNPITHDLGTVELPVNPAPDLTAWADGGSAQPNMSMEYERALSIVIPRIEAAISDLATS